MTNKQYHRLDSNRQMPAAIARAKASKLFVKPASQYRSYTVVNRENGNAYTVEFMQMPSGAKLGRCSCPATTLCKHLAASVAVHVAVAAARS